MLRAHIIRMYPTKEQHRQLCNTLGASRYAYNWALKRWESLYKDFTEGKVEDKPSAFGLSKLWTDEKPEWANETSRDAQQRAILNLGKAYKSFFKGLTKKPTLHKKGGKESFYIQNSHARFYGRTINLPNIGRVKLAELLRYNGKIQGYTVTHYADQWHLVVTVDTVEDVRPVCSNKDSVVGIDVGLAVPATASDGTVCTLPEEKMQRLEKHLKKYQKRLSRSKSSKTSNHTKLLKRKQKVQNRINNIRKDVAHKFTTAITKSHGTVVVEDLDIQEMKDKAEWKSLRRTFNSSMMSMILFQLEYKAQKLIKVNRFFPSSKMCSNCGHKKENLELSERTYTCEACGFSIDRDLNAALNLMKSGMVNPVVSVE